MLYGHRGVGYWIACGVEPEVILCDIAYKEGGTNKGKGGPMHLVDPARGVLGETGSLGGNFVIGVGIAYAEQYRGSGNVAVVFFGDGTANRGQFHEALNFAGLAQAAHRLLLREQRMGTVDAHGCGVGGGRHRAGARPATTCRA